MTWSDFTHNKHLYETLAPPAHLSYRITRMKIKQTLLTFAAITMIGSFVFAGTTVLAQEQCAGVDTSIIKCDDAGDSTQETGVWYLLIIALNILTAGVGIAAVGGLVYAAVLYASARESADQVQKAKTIIRDVVIGLVAYAGMYLIINFLIPGGIFT